MGLFNQNTFSIRRCYTGLVIAEIRNSVLKIQCHISKRENKKTYTNFIIVLKEKKTFVEQILLLQIVFFVQFL